MKEKSDPGLHAHIERLALAYKIISKSPAEKFDKIYENIVTKPARKERFKRLLKRGDINGKNNL